MRPLGCLQLLTTLVHTGEVASEKYSVSRAQHEYNASTRIAKRQRDQKAAPSKMRNRGHRDSSKEGSAADFDTDENCPETLFVGGAQ